MNFFTKVEEFYFSIGNFFLKTPYLHKYKALDSSPNWFGILMMCRIFCIFLYIFLMIIWLSVYWRRRPFFWAIQLSHIASQREHAKTVAEEERFTIGSSLSLSSLSSLRSCVSSPRSKKTVFHTMCLPSNKRHFSPAGVFFFFTPGGSFYFVSYSTRSTHRVRGAHTQRESREHTQRESIAGVLALHIPEVILILL